MDFFFFLIKERHNGLSKDTEVPLNTSCLFPPTRKMTLLYTTGIYKIFFSLQFPALERCARRDRVSDRRTWVTDGGSSSSLSDESLLSDVSSGFAAPGTVVDVGLAWFGTTAVCLTAFFLTDTGAAGALFTGAALTCTVFTGGFAWEQEEQKGTGESGNISQETY